MKRLCVYCGSNPGIRADYLAAARDLGRLLLDRHIGLVYGGGNVGVMGEIAQRVLDGGGEVIGVIPEFFVGRVAHMGLTKLHITDSMHQRKAIMHELADGFIAMPGGLGTLEEIFEALTWAQLGIHSKPCGFLNVAGYFDGLFTFLNHTVTEQFVKPEHYGLIMSDASPAGLVDKMESYTCPKVDKWFGL